MSDIKDVWFALVNPYAGSGKTMPLWRKAEQMMYRKGIVYKEVQATSPDEAAERVKKAAEAGYRRFMAVGGDGTVHLVLGALAEYCEAGKCDAGDAVMRSPRLEDFTLVMLPIGSGNDFLRSHNVPKDHEVITDMMASGSFALQDVVRVELSQKIHYLANIGGYNFDANVCDKVNVMKAQGKEGKLIYVRVLFALAGVQKAHRTKVLCDGVEVFDDKLYTISIGNGRFSGGGLCQTPSAVIDDGILNIMVAPVFPLWKLPLYIGKLFKERTEEIPFLHFFSGKVIEILPSDQGQLVEVDGEVVGRAPVRFSVLDQQIKVLHRG